MHEAPYLTKAGRMKEMMTVASIEARFTWRWLCYFNALLRNHFNKIYFSPYYYYYRPHATNILFFVHFSLIKRFVDLETKRAVRSY
jgi:hypothetical protein